MRTIYVVDIEKIDYAFLDNDLQTIQFEIFQTYPIVKDKIIMDINTIQKFRSIIDEMFKLKKKKEKRKKINKLKGGIKE